MWTTIGTILATLIVLALLFFLFEPSRWKYARSPITDTAEERFIAGFLLVCMIRFLWSFR